LLFTLVSFQYSWAQPEQDALWATVGLLFAYDFCVFASSLSGICCDYAAQHEITTLLNMKFVFNCNKTVGVVFPPQNLKQQPATLVVSVYAVSQGFPNWGTCTPRGTFNVRN